VARGHYLPHAQTPAGPELAALVLDYAGPRALLTGHLAARAAGMRWVPDDERVQALVPAEVRRRPRPPFSVRRTAGFDELVPWLWHGLPMAPPPRIVLDTALATPSLRDVRGVVLGAVLDGWTTPEELAQLVACEPRNGTRLLNRAIRDASHGAASPPEAECADALRGCGLPFLLNAELWVGSRFVGKPDGYFVGLGAGWEVDSREHHETERDFDRTLARHDGFGGYGLVLAHLTPKRMRRDPAQAADAVLAVARRRLLLPPHLREPEGLRIVPKGPLLR
jgi:hypothetical protein